MSDGPTWYDILGVDSSAGADEIKAAWRHATDKFEPGSGQSQFRLFNEAADVLLDPARRAEYDAQLSGTSARGPKVRKEKPAREPRPEPAAEAVPPAADLTAEAPGRSRLTLVLSSLVVLSLLVAIVFAVLIKGRAGDDGIGFFEGVTNGQEIAQVDAGNSAAAAAERALVAAVSYDYRRLDADKKRALGFMTPSYGKTFAGTFDKLLTAAKEGQPNNVVKTKTVVRASVSDVGVVNGSTDSTDRVRILAFVNQTATKGDRSPTIFRNRIEATMVLRDGVWLIDGLKSY